MDYELKKLRHREKNKKEIKIPFFINKLLFIIMLTIISLILLKNNVKFKEKFYHEIYEKNFSFSKINSLYKEKFGTPIPFSNLIKSKIEPTFNETLSYTSKEKYKDGVALTVSENYLVPSIDGGIIIFKGEKEGYGSVVIVEEENGVEVWYGNITSDLKIYDYIEKGTLVGEANGKLYMVFKKDGEILNYEDYI